MEVLKNPFLGRGMECDAFQGVPFPSVDVASVRALLDRCPKHGATELVDAQFLAQQAGVAKFFVKDERSRMGLGSFKALGAAFVIARDAVTENAINPEGALAGRTYVTASAGNHGMSVAAGAKVFGATAVIYLANTVPESFAGRLAAMGATVVRAGDDYEASMAAAQQAAADNNWALLTDSSWAGYTDMAHGVMQGYMQMAAEAIEQMPCPPSHVFLQAGVGGMAGAMAALIRKEWNTTPVIVVVEPEFAPALIDSIRAGKPVATTGPVSDMGRLDCKEPSFVALKGLARDADYFLTITEEQAACGVEIIAKAGLETSASGGAGMAAALIAPNELGLDENSVVLTFLSEGPA